MCKNIERHSGTYVNNNKIMKSQNIEIIEIKYQPEITGRTNMRVAIITNPSNIEITEVDEEDKRVFGMNVTLYKESSFGRSENSLKWKISWGSIGSVSVDTAKKQSALLNCAINLATKLNK